MHMELLQLVDVRVEEASRPFREEVANLKLLLAALVILWIRWRHVLVVVWGSFPRKLHFRLTPPT
jgi:hypothetical protein